MAAFTSYYANPNLPKNAILVSISVSHPRAFIVNATFKEVQPSYKELVEPHKRGQISDSYYRAKYMQQLERSKQIIIEKYEKLLKIAGNQPVVFLCWCKPDKFCHRHVFAEFLNMYSEFKVNEL